MSATVKVRPVKLMTSTELIDLLDRVNPLATVSGRPGPVERLARARARMARRQMRVVIAGAPGQGVTSLIQVLQRTAADWLPGARFAAAPGSPRQNQLPMPEPGSADVVLFVSEAGHEYSKIELDAMARIRATGIKLVGVLTKIDLYPKWTEVQQANRWQLNMAKLNSPVIPLLPVSSTLCVNGRRNGDKSLTVSSGVPQLLEFLRDQVGTAVERELSDSVLEELRAAVNQLSAFWNLELDQLRSYQSPREWQKRAVAELARRQQLSADWQLALSDGAAELMGQVDFDLRSRLRNVMELAEQKINKSNPRRNWEQFNKWLRDAIEESVRATFELTWTCSYRLAEQVAAKLVGNQHGVPNGLPLPHLVLRNPDNALNQIKSVEGPGKGGAFSWVVNGMRGSYGGILMVGVLTSLAGLSLISVWSVAAGVLMGLYTFWEERKNAKERGRAEAKLAVSKLMDDVNFRVGDELRSQLRIVHCSLRDHFTKINDQQLRVASDAVQAAADAAAQDGGRYEARFAELQRHLSELRQLKAVMTV